MKEKADVKKPEATPNTETVALTHRQLRMIVVALNICGKDMLENNQQDFLRTHFYLGQEFRTLSRLLDARLPINGGGI